MLSHAQAKTAVDHLLKYSNKEKTTRHTPLTVEVPATGEVAEGAIPALLEADMPVEEPVIVKEAVADEAEADPEEDEATIAVAGADVVDEVVSRVKVALLQQPLQQLQLEVTLDLH